MKDIFEDALRKDLHHAEQQLDAHTRFRLATARAQAMAATPRRWSFSNVAVPAFGITLASLALLLLTPSSTTNLVPGNDSDLRPSNLELYQDLDFYYWLAEREVDGKS
ncbi:MAG: hypothetical protein ACSLE5_12750 [Porticoccaceae bacterium]